MTTRAAFVACLMSACALPALAVAAEATTAAATTAAAAGAGAVDEVVVTGARSELPTLAASDAVKFGGAVQVVSAQEIRLSGAANFAELTQFLVKGVNIGYSPDEGEYTIRLDGGSDRDTLVIRDGVPLYDRGPALEDIWSSTTIDPHMIENIEVFRGGNSLFYGSNGGIGVISLVSKKPQGAFKAEAGVAFGSFRSRELWGNVTVPIDREGKHSIMVYGSYQASDGPRIFDPNLFVDNVKAAGGVQKYPLNRNDVGVKYLWKIDDKTQLRLAGEYTESWFQDPFPDGEIHSPNTVRYPIFDASLERRWSPMLLTEASAYYTNPHIWNTELYPDICKVQAGCTNPSTNAKVKFGDYTGLSYSNGPFHGFGEGTQPVAGFKEMGGTIRNTVDLDYLQFVVGGQVVQYKDDSDPIYPVGDGEETVKGLFLDARPKLSFSPGTAISLAIRHDWLGEGVNKTIWKFGVRQPLWGGTYVRANGGTSYSLPKNTELRNDTSTTVGNPLLAPETTKTFNGAFGINREFGDVTVGLEVGGFKTEVSDRIQGTTDFRIPATGTFGPRNTYFNNKDLTKIDGLTVDFNLNIGTAWRVNLGYTAQNARLATGPLANEQINETPAWFMNGTIEWTAPGRRFNIALMPRIQGSEYVRGGLAVGGIAQTRTNFGNYKVFNLSANYYLGENRQHQFQIRIVNIFNEYYAERYGFGNQRFGSAFNRGEYGTNSPKYFFGYPFEGKPRAAYVSYSLTL
jgi:iron complex outermembrane receptor protein